MISEVFPLFSEIFMKWSNQKETLQINKISNLTITPSYIFADREGEGGVWFQNLFRTPKTHIFYFVFWLILRQIILKKMKFFKKYVKLWDYIKIPQENPILNMPFMMTILCIKRSNCKELFITMTNYFCN